jgi:uncharacterized membrane protein
MPFVLVLGDEPGLLLEEEIPRSGSSLRPTTLRGSGATVRGMRRALLTFHIVCSVALLGDSAGYLAVAVRAATTDDPRLAAASYELLEMFSIVFGIPLSFAALLSGLALTRVTKWGVIRHRWVTAKLLAILSVILVGAFVIGPSNATMQSGGSDSAELALILASGWDVLVLTLATGLSVYKPRLRSRTTGDTSSGSRSRRPSPTWRSSRPESARTR